ncbi:MAG: anti-sigma factor family protein [Ktedonobacteraceae bacterium]
MNCTKAQVLLAAHRELKNSDTVELDAHLEQCAQCRQVLASSHFISDQVRSLPAIEPPPAMHTSLMERLAAEHTQYLQHSPSNALLPPAFLQPYLQQHAHSSKKTSPLAAFSTADTGPLPVVSTVRKKSRRSNTRQFAFIGLAAVFFLTLMMGSITSLLLLANSHIGSGPELTINHPTDVVGLSYKTTTNYQHVVSAVADTSSIYYTAYGNGLNDGWMLERLDRSTKISTPLLNTPSPSPLVMLGSNNGWLLWLQSDAPKTIAQSNTIHHPLPALLRAWSVHYLRIGPPLDTTIPTSIATPPVPMTLLSGTFNQDVAPDWVHTPIQGIWFVGNTLLVTMIDGNGISHLMRYQLDTKNNAPITEIAKASPGHIFTSPTANADGTQIFWSEEWRTDDSNLHSNIWTQQSIEGPMPTHGRLLEHSLITKELFLQDGMSFRPVVVDDALIFLSTAPTASVTPTPTNSTATVSPSPIASAVATPNTSNTSGISWADSSIYTAPLDNGIRGNVLLLPLNGNPSALPTQLNNLGMASSLQVGTTFVLWQSDDGSYGMYDVPAKTAINVGTVLDGAQFLAINGGTAVWTVNTAIDPSTNTTTPATTLSAFNWPRP